MPGVKGKSGGARIGAGRPPETVTIRGGDGIFISHVMADGTADMGWGRVEVRKATRGGKLLVIPQPDGSEIRILIAP